MWSPLQSILVCTIPQFLTKSYRFGQLIIPFQKVNILRLLKIYIRFGPPVAKYPFFRLQLMDYNTFLTYLCSNSLLHVFTCSKSAKTLRERVELGQAIVTFRLKIKSRDQFQNKWLGEGDKTVNTLQVSAQKRS